MANPMFVNVKSAQPPLGDAVLPLRADESGPQKAEPQPIGGPRPKLFYERYGILENPFGVTPNPRYLYQSRTHAEARSSLIIGIECGVGFQALIAPPGMGKTTILFSLLERFNNVARTAFLFQTHDDSRDFLRYLISELGGETHDSDPVGMQDTINHLLMCERRAGRQTIIIVDEAQSLDTPVLETLRLLSNFETPTEKLLQIILAGQTQLAQRLATPEAAQLYQRISIRTTLVPFDLEDTRNYIEHRLKIAGYQGPPLFTPAAVRSILERSGGVPREINTLCFNSLLLATAIEQKQVDSEILHEVAADLDLNPIPFNKDMPPRGIRAVQTADVLRLGDATADPPATSIDKTCKAVSSGGKTEADDASTRLSGFDGVDLVELGTIAAEIVSTSSEVKAEQAPALGAKMEADAASARPTAFDEVDLVQLGKIAPKRDSTNSGINAEEAPVPGVNAKTHDASTRPTVFDEIDLAQLGKIAPKRDSTNSGINAEQAPVPGVNAKADDASTRPTVFDDIDLVQLGKIAPKRDSTSSGKNADKAAVPGAGAESDDIVGRVFLPTRPALASHRKTDMVIFAGAGVAGAPRRETEATGSSTDALQAILEARAAVEAAWMPEAKHDLSSGNESELTSKGRFDSFTGIKPDLKIEIKSKHELGVESTPEVEPGVAAVVRLRNILAEKDAVPEAAQQSLWKIVTKPFTSKQQREAHRATLYLGTSMLILLLVLSDSAWLSRTSPEPNHTIFKELLLSLGLAAPPAVPVHYDNADVGVWVDLHTGLYYCPDARLYGKTRGGKFTTQRQARQEHFKTADGRVCQ